MKKIGVSILILTFSLIICGAKEVPSIELRNSKNSNVQLTYETAVKKDNVLTIYTNYSSNEGFEIIEDIVVSTDENFTTILPPGSCKIENGKYQYTFNYNGNIDKVYIKPPVVYVPHEISPVTVSLHSNARTAQLNNNEWFSIDDIDTEMTSDGVYDIILNFSVHNDTIPRLPRLNINDEILGALSLISFDEASNFDEGQLIFTYTSGENIDINALLDEATLTISETIIKTDAGPITRSSGSQICVLDVISQ